MSYEDPNLREEKAENLIALSTQIKAKTNAWLQAKDPSVKEMIWNECSRLIVELIETAGAGMTELDFGEGSNIIQIRYFIEAVANILIKEGKYNSVRPIVKDFSGKVTLSVQGSMRRTP